MSLTESTSASQTTLIALEPLPASNSFLSTADIAHSVHDQPSSRQQDALPPTDQGWHAWLALAGDFVFNATVWGFAFSYGVLQEYYTSHEPFASQGQAGSIPAIGTTSTGIMYLTMPIFMWAFRRWPNARRWSMAASLPMVTASLVGASFATRVSQLIAFQGVLYGFAGNMLCMPGIIFLNEWFVRKRGLAIGIAIAGDFLGGVAMPLLLQLALERIGFRWTLRMFAAIIVILSLPFVTLIRPRLPIPKVYVAPPTDTSFLRTSFFWVVLCCYMIQALGYFLPTNYLPSIAKESLGLSKTLGSLTVLCVNSAACIGCIVVGALTDRFDVTLVLFTLSVLASVTIFAVLGFSSSAPPLYLFSLLYGLFAAPYSTCLSGIIRELQRQKRGTDANLVFGLLSFGRGIGSVVSGPISGSLIVKSHPALTSSTPSIYGGEYGSIVIFTGCTAFAGGLSWLVRRAGII